MQHGGFSIIFSIPLKNKKPAVHSPVDFLFYQVRLNYGANLAARFVSLPFLIKFRPENLPNPI